MSAAELHRFGIDVVLPQLATEGVTVEAVNGELDINPQVVAQRWGSLAYIFVRTAMYPSKGTLSAEELQWAIDWSNEHHAALFLARIGLVCTNYPDRSLVRDDADLGRPIRNGGFAVSYEGLELIVTADRIQVWSGVPQS